MAYDRIWISKPPYGTLIDWRSSLAIGIQSFLPCNEGSGLPFNVINKSRCTLASGSSVTWAPGGISSSLGTGAIIQVAEVVPNMGQLWTAGIIFNFSAFQASFPYISALFYNPFTICRLGDASLADNQPQIVFGSTKTNSSGITLGLHALVVTLGANIGGNVIQSLYIDGTLAVSQTVGYNSINNYFNTLFSDGTGGRQPAGTLYAYGEWARCLSAGEVASWSNNPWQIFSSPTATRFFPSPASITYIYNTDSSTSIENQNTSLLFYDNGSLSEQSYSTRSIYSQDPTSSSENLFISNLLLSEEISQSIDQSLISIFNNESGTGFEPQLVLIISTSSFYSSDSAYGIDQSFIINVTPSLLPCALILTGPTPPSSAHGAVEAYIGQPVGPFTVQPTQVLNGTVYLSDAATNIPNNTTLFLLSSGTFDPPALTFYFSIVPQQFYYTPTVMGLRPISISSPQATSSAPVWIFTNPSPPLMAGLPRCP